MKIYRLFSYSLFIVFGAFQLSAQVAQIPFETKDNGHIYLKVKVNDSDKVLNFVFDTGATSDLLDIKTSKSLGLKPNYQQSVEGAGGSKTYDIILNQQLHLEKGISIDNTNLVLTDLSSFHELSDRGFYGIIGYSLIRKFITKIDYETNELILYKKLNEVNLSGYKAIPFKFGNGIPIPQFDISITLKNGETFSGRILFDSGAGLTLSVNTPFSKQKRLSEKSGKSIVSKSQNLSRTSISEEVAISSLTIGGYEFKDLTITLSNDTSGVSAYPNYLGIMGAKIIQRFNVVLDYSSKRLYIKPNRKFDSAFEFPVSGIRLKNIEGKIIVDDVVDSSQAYKLGLRKGDQVIAVNDTKSKEVSTFRRMLKKEGKEVTVKVLKPTGETKNYTFKLVRLL
ncbi:MAG: aspartyl protease family protein [Flavobacteriaceae bacterium]